MTDQYAHSDEDDILAGEYVLGVLTLSERLAVESRMKLDTGFARRVGQWENDLGTLNDGYAELRAPNVLGRVEARLFPKKRKASGFSWFQFFLGSSTAAVLALALFLSLPNQRPAELTATLRGETPELVFAARFDGRSLLLDQTDGPAPAGNSVYQVWLIAGDAAPVSLGLIQDGELNVPMPDQTRALTRGMVLAISLEPAGGSPTGAPTGPVLVTGVVES
jgi:anti-sigma-K factor RskA